MTQKEKRKFYVDQGIVIKRMPSRQFSSTSAAKKPKSEDIIHINKNKNRTEKTVTLVVKKIDNQAQRRELEKIAKKVLKIFAEESVLEEDDDNYSGGLFY